MANGEWSRFADGVKGWAACADNGEPAWVEILVDGIPVGITRADLPGRDNNEFCLLLPVALREQEVRLELRIANSCEYLSEQIMQSPEQHGLCGEINTDRGLTVSGWALDLDNGDATLPIFAYVDGVKMAETVADERKYRPAQADGHGFILKLPMSVADGRNHLVDLRDDKGRSLPGSPYKLGALAGNAGDWLRQQKKLEKPQIDLLSNLLGQMEARLPGIAGNPDYGNWQRLFPTALPKGRQKATICGLLPLDAKALKNQEGIELKLNQERPEFILLAGRNESLHPRALANMVAELRAHNAALIYADAENGRGQPMFKPAWDRDTFLAHDYLGPALIRTSVLDHADIRKGEKYASARFKAILAAEQAGRILHLPEVLSRGDAEEINRDPFIQAWLDANHPGSLVEAGRVKYHCGRTPRISIIILTRDHGEMLRNCLDSMEKTDWPDYELIIVDNGTVEADALTVLERARQRPNICVIQDRGVFNYALLTNKAAQRASGEYLCFLNNDTEVLNPAWLREMAALLLKEESRAGCVGAKLLWPNGLVQHGGVIVGTHQLASHVGNGWLDNEPGYMGRNQYAQQYSAVTAACCLTPTSLFLANGGFDAQRFPVAFNDVDYCLRIREQGKKVYWTPFSRVLHHESASRGTDREGSAKARAEREMNLFRLKWGHYEDPFYNPNLPLSTVGEPFDGLALPPRPRNSR